MARTRLTLAASLLLLAGCGLDVTPLGDGGTPGPSTSPTVEPPNSPESPESLEASGTPSTAGSTVAVRRAIRRLFLARTGRVTTTLSVGADRVLDEARYDITRGFSFRRQLVSGEDELVIEGVVLGNDLWYRVLEPREIRCWVHTTPEVLAGFSTRDVAWTPLAAAPRPLVPNGLNVVSTFKSTSGADSTDTHTGTTRLSLVVELLGAPALEASGLTRADRTRVTAQTRIVDGRLVTLAVDGESLSEALNEADADVGSADAASMRAVVSFSLEGDPVELAAPDPTTVVELTTDQDQFEEDLTACERTHR